METSTFHPFWYTELAVLSFSIYSSLALLLSHSYPPWFLADGFQSVRKVVSSSPCSFSFVCVLESAWMNFLHVYLPLFILSTIRFSMDYLGSIWRLRLLSGKHGGLYFSHVFCCCPCPPVEENAVQEFLQFPQPVFHAFVDILLEKGYWPHTPHSCRIYSPLAR